MTPEEARQSIHDAEDLRANLPADCWRALETIAGMREEWGVAVTYPGMAEVVEWGYSTRDGAEAEGTSLDTEYRIVRRYVTEPEEA